MKIKDNMPDEARLHRSVVNACCKVSLPARPKKYTFTCPVCEEEYQLVPFAQDMWVPSPLVKKFGFMPY